MDVTLTAIFRHLRPKIQVRPEGGQRQQCCERHCASPSPRRSPLRRSWSGIGATTTNKLGRQCHPGHQGRISTPWPSTATAAPAPQPWPSTDRDRRLMTRQPRSPAVELKRGLDQLRTDAVRDDLADLGPASPASLVARRDGPALHHPPRALSASSVESARNRPTPSFSRNITIWLAIGPLPCRADSSASASSPRLRAEPCS